MSDTITDPVEDPAPDEGDTIPPADDTVESGEGVPIAGGNPFHERRLPDE